MAVSFTQGLSLLSEFLNSDIYGSNSFKIWLENQKPGKCDLWEEIKSKFELSNKEKSSRLFIDGVFDLTHSGHYNAIRRAKQLTQTLVVGVDSQEEVIKFKKSTPIFTEKERLEMAGACRWADEISHAKIPYSPTIELIDSLNCGSIAHGDDIIIGEDGKSIYQEFIDADRFK